MASSTGTLFPAHSATCAGGMPSLSHFVSRVCRMSYTRFPNGEPNSCGVKIRLTGDRQARRMTEPASMPPASPLEQQVARLQLFGPDVLAAESS